MITTIRKRNMPSVDYIDIIKEEKSVMCRRISTQRNIEWNERKEIMASYLGEITIHGRRNEIPSSFPTFVVTDVLRIFFYVRLKGTTLRTWNLTNKFHLPEAFR
ncbi:hypothetical protein TNCT_108351 [Trichonephila clavata]|uniref:Uncharacterized protein n=1 Tax=Trichonephila clavata TaxID=2740835 RepID=A0A8X6LW16_TRICU|nr:hypothetical protein TNCT_108351 [Trichonephila clavata]